MRRIDDGMDWVELDKIASYRGLKLVYRAARCQHGKTRQQTCRDCEAGYVDDTHTFANVGNVATTAAGVALIAVSDDGESVAYVPASQQNKRIAHCLTCGGTYPCGGTLQGTHHFKSDKE